MFETIQDRAFIELDIYFLSVAGDELQTRPSDSLGVPLSVKEGFVPVVKQRGYGETV